MQCTGCGGANPEGARFCVQCGTALARACPACGAAVAGAQKFCASCGRALAVAVAAAPQPAPVPADDGERRQATVVFSDLTGYTALTERLDPEEISEIMSRVKREAATLVEQHGGTVNQFVGDEVMALFGVPVARRDDAQRAVRAAFELHRIVREISVELEPRIGAALAMHSAVNTGLVVVRRSDSRDGQFAVTGDTVNTASRLLDLAGADEVVAGQDTWRQVSDAFEGEARTPVKVKGKDQPLAYWRIVEERRASEGGRRPLVGRTEELRQFAALAQACVERKRGRVIILRGDPGIGKSRLLAEFASLARRMGFTCHSSLVLDFSAGKGRDAIGSLARSLVGVPAGSGKKARRAALVRAMSEGLAAPEQEVFLCNLLDVPPPPELRAIHAAITESARKRGVIETLCELVRRMSARAPLAVLVEDIHWADGPTLEQLAALGGVGAAHPVLLAVTTRFAGDPSAGAWRAALHGVATTSIDLAPLARDEALEMVAQFSSMSAAVAQAWVDRAEGNALFLEQLLLNGEEAALANLPGSIQSLVLARMDRLAAPDRQALQAAAVLGQRFALAALHHLIENAAYDCRALIEHYLLRSDGAEYFFCHALIRDGAYESLLKARRRQLHARAAEWFATRDRVLCAEHYDRAGHAMAASAYLSASDGAAVRYDYDSALALAERGLSLAERREEKFALTGARARILLDKGRAQDAIDSWRAALELAEGREERCRTLIGLAQGMRIVDRATDGLAALDEAETLAQQAGLAFELARLNHLRGNLFFGLGRPRECLAAHETALVRAQEARSVEAEANALSGLGDAHYLSGRMRSAHEQFSRCVELARQQGLGRIEVANRHMMGWSALYLDRLRYALDAGRETVDMAMMVSHRRVEIIARHLIANVGGWLIGDIALGRTHLDAALRIAQDLGAKRFEGQNRLFRAQLVLREGNREAAHAMAREALGFCRAHGMEFVGAIALALVARLSSDAEERGSLLAEGEALLARGAISHNHFEFYVHAIESALEWRDWDGAERYCAALERYSSDEPLPWSDLLIARGRALARCGRGVADATLGDRLRSLREKAASNEYHLVVPALDAALSRLESQ